MKRYNGSTWDIVGGVMPVKATGAEVDTGTDDAKYVTPKAIEDSSYIKASALPVKATGAEITTGTDDAKFATAKALADAGIIAPPGAWTAPAFLAGNFTASGSMTWTVESGDVLSYAYSINGKTMIVSFSLITTSVGGALSSALYIKIPASKTAVRRVDSVCRGRDNGINATFYVHTVAGTTNIQIGFFDGANWSASTNLTYIFGAIIFEIN